MRWPTGILALVVGLSAWLAPSSGSAQRQRRLRVRVVDVAGSNAYISPGAGEGLYLGAEVTFRRQSHRVTAVTQTYGVVSLGDEAIAVGAEGTAAVRTAEDAGPSVTRLPAPTPLSELEGRWPRAPLPAATQEVTPVSLGNQVGAAHRLRTDVMLSGYVFIPGATPEDTLGHAQLRARVHAQPFLEHPFTIDADVAVALWLGREWGAGPGARSRPNLRVRQLQIAWGNQEDFYASLGRLRYAASNLGQLDGLRVQTPPLGPITIGAFGGFVPDAQTGVPDFNVARFGLEATYRDFESDLRPVISLVGQGSVFDGEPDERRLSASFHLYPGESHIGGYVEVSNFDQDNPWGSPQVDVTAASLDTTLRFDWLRIGARASMRQPERSTWLATLFPTSWLCTPRQASGGAPDFCDPFFDVRLMGNVDVGVEVGDVALTVGGTLVHIGSRRSLAQLGGFAAFRAVRLAGWGHFDASVMVSSSEAFETWGLSAAIGVELVPEAIDFTLRYRPALSRYAPDITYYTEHLMGVRILVRPIPELDVLFDGDAILGRQIDAFILNLSVAWHGAF